MDSNTHFYPVCLSVLFLHNINSQHEILMNKPVAVGSATQISLFVTPLIVLVGWAVDRPLTLNFPPFEICLFILSVFVVFIVVSNSKSNWLEGSMLIITYAMLAVGFWFEKVQDYGSELE